MSEVVTLLTALGEALAQAGQYNKDDQAPPEAILWTDKERQWTAPLPELRARLSLLTSGGPLEALEPLRIPGEPVTEALRLSGAAGIIRA